MDWNGDGKHDWHDDAFIYTVVHSDDEPFDDDPSTHWLPSGGCWLVLAILAMLIFFFF